MLVNELVQGHGLARELESQLSPASIELCKSLAQDVLASIEKAIAMAKVVAVATDHSPRSFTGSPHSEISEHPFRAEGRDMIPKKRYVPVQVTVVDETRRSDCNRILWCLTAGKRRPN